MLSLLNMDLELCLRLALEETNCRSRRLDDSDYEIDQDNKLREMMKLNKAG